MDIRRAETGDLDRIMEIYAYARGFMAETGNPNQWIGGYPQRELAEDDLRKGELYVMEAENRVCGVFTFPIGPDPTYAVIEDGAWPEEETEYGTIHRIAGDGSVHGLLPRCIEFCFQLVNAIRIDTHDDNKIMQRQIEKCGFIYCGKIRSRDGSPRLAYELRRASWKKTR